MTAMNDNYSKWAKDALAVMASLEEGYSKEEEEGHGKQPTLPVSQEGYSKTEDEGHGIDRS